MMFTMSGSTCAWSGEYKGKFILCVCLLVNTPKCAGVQFEHTASEPVVLDVGHAVVDKARHEVYGGVVVANDELADVGADVRQVCKRKNVLWTHHEELARDARDAARALDVHAKEVAVDLRLHRMAEVELLDEVVDALEVSAALQRQQGLREFASHDLVLVELRVGKDPRSPVGHQSIDHGTYRKSCTLTLSCRRCLTPEMDSTA